MSQLYDTAAQAVREAEFLLFPAGAGMGVDSGLPDFRGTQGFWNAYPAFAKLGLNFQQLANPRWFSTDPALAWGFYGHRLNLYRETVPHAGFAVLKRWAEQKPAHVFTSNVDGQFQKAGLGDVYEIHGSILHLQCSLPCDRDIWSVGDTAIEVDPDTMRASGDLPQCPHCGRLARPAILMFGDSYWVDDRSEKQRLALERFMRKHAGRKLTIIEMGAGTAVPSVRYMSESFQNHGAKLVRINVREGHGPDGTIGLEVGAREALETMDDLL